MTEETAIKKGEASGPARASGDKAEEGEPTADREAGSTPASTSTATSTPTPTTPASTPTPSPSPTSTATSKGVAKDWRKYAFALVPALGLLELGLHLKQTSSVATEADWKEARSVVAQRVKPSDLVVFAPQWSEPLGRQYFGDELASLERVARPDETRFPRAIEVSMRGARRDELAGWKEVDVARAGPFTIRTLENPSPVTLVDDLLKHVNPNDLAVSRVEGDSETPCTFVRTGVQSGGLGFGPAIPGERFTCPGGGFVGLSVTTDPDYVPRRCIFAPPLGGSTVLRLRFKNVKFGTRLHGHHTNYVEADHVNGAPVVLSFRAQGKALGRFTRRDGQGWTPFEVDTSDLADQTGELIADISAANSNRRLYCFEADTR